MRSAKISLFYKYNFIRTRGLFLLKFKNKLRTIQPRQKNKVSNFQLKYWTKQQQVAHNSQSTFCFIAYLRTTASARIQVKT